MVNNFNVKTDVFEGPLELLLSMVEKRKLLVNDVSLASVADDYIEHIKELNEFPVPDAANFLLVASTLVLIKSKSLLHTIELSESERSDIEELERRLNVYKRVRFLSRMVEKNFDNNPIFSIETRAEKKEVVFAPHKKVVVENLKESMQLMLNKLPKGEEVTKVVIERVMSLTDMIQGLTERIQKNMKMSFSEFSKNGGSQKEQKLNLVISFLAMLELVKQGVLQVQQNDMFDEIVMETSSPSSTPNYS